MSILVLVQHDNTTLNPATLNALAAAQQIAAMNTAGENPADIHLLIAGYNCQPVAEAATSLSDVSQVLVCDAEQYEQGLAENLAALIEQQAQSGYSHVLAPSTSRFKDCLPRAAALLGVGQISDIIAVVSGNSYQRPVYAGNAIATVESLDSIQVISVRTSAFDAAEATGGEADIHHVGALAETGLSTFVGEEMAQSSRPELASADTIVSVGRGIGSADNLPVVEQLADKLGAALGASRAAVDAGFVSNDLQVGQTGKIVAPQLYVAVGISGAIQHLAGMKDSKIIVAINKDEEAPIFQVADYGLAADLFDAVPELIEKL